MALKFGLFLPPFVELAEPRRVVELAQAAEHAGWDGFFLWDHILFVPGMPIAEPWVTMGAIAQATSAMRLGMLVTPLARRRPWVIARETATLDHLSNGRLIVGVGLGDDGLGEFGSFRGEPVDPKDRAEILDESLTLLRQFWSGTDVRFEGKHHSVECGPFLPRPVQDPLPVWVAGRWPHPRPLNRAARHQGYFPLFDQGGWEVPVFPDPGDVAAARAGVASADIDIVCRGVSSQMEPRDRSKGFNELEAAGMTWWLESFGPGHPPVEVAEEIIRRGPAPSS